MLFKYKRIFLKRIMVLAVFIYFIESIFVVTYAENYEWTVINNIDTIETNSTVQNEQENSIENSVTSKSDELNLQCESAILIEQNSGKILYEKNAHEQLRPASVTKLMTLLIIFETLENGQITLQDKVPCSQTASSMGGSQIWLDTREELTVDEMIKAMCVVSANDCTVAMAEYIAGSEAEFVNLMNKKAEQLGMKDTTFKNCHGIDEDGHITSSYDISLMSKELLNKYPDITNYTTIFMDTLRDGKSQLVNTNKLVRNYKGATGLKTGSTSLALYNLSASATRDDLSLIAVVMKAPTSAARFEDATKILDYGFKTYEAKSFGKEGDIVGKINVEKGVEKSMEVILEKNCSCIMEKGKGKDVVQKVQMESVISAPVYKNQKIGSVIYELDGEIIEQVNIIAQKDIPKETVMNMASYIYEKWFCLLRE
ncbi:MAG: D-alanyl-D-alanine carboxypeptidase [Clostridiales bacterium]|nr:D-alanyl-D-alanine carboxypeptidase [Clostridiales bacterium]